MSLLRSSFCGFCREKNRFLFLSKMKEVVFFPLISQNKLRFSGSGAHFTPWFGETLFILRKQLSVCWLEDPASCHVKPCGGCI